MRFLIRANWSAESRLQVCRSLAVYSTLNGWGDETKITTTDFSFGDGQLTNSVSHTIVENININGTDRITNPSHNFAGTATAKFDWHVEIPAEGEATGTAYGVLEGSAENDNWFFYHPRPPLERIGKPEDPNDEPVLYYILEYPETFDPVNQDPPRPPISNWQETIDPGVFEPTSSFWAGTKAFTYEFGKGAADVITDEIPYLGQAKALDKLVNDRNLVTGEDDLGAIDRYSSVIDLVPGGSTLKKAGKGFGALFGFTKSAADTVKASSRVTRNADLAAEASQQALKRIPTSVADESAERLSKANDDLQSLVIQPEGGCFAADTPVATPTGTRPIGEIRPGDLVLAFDHTSGTWSPRHVEKIHENIYEDSLVTIETESDTIRATLYHPVWVVAGRDLEDRPVCQELEPNEDEGFSLEGRWVNSHDLRPGDVLINTAGQKQYVMRVAQEFVSGLAIVNLTVEGDHTFAVGDCGVLVHNTCAKPVAADGAYRTADGHYIEADEIAARPDLNIRGEGVIYKTRTDPPYVGSADDLELRDAYSTDGRVRDGAEILDTYLQGDNLDRFTKERNWVEHFGIENLDNIIHPPHPDNLVP